MDESRCNCVPISKSAILVAAVAVAASMGMMCPPDGAIEDPALAALLAPAPTYPLNSYDWFGKTLDEETARLAVLDAGLDPEDEASYMRLGMVHVTEELIERGRVLFLQDQLGDSFSLGNILSFASEFGKSPIESVFDSFEEAKDPDGTKAFLREVLLTSLLRPKVATTNLEVTLARDLKLGTSVIPEGTVIRTGLDVQEGSFIPVGFDGGTVSCAICHASVDPMTGRQVIGRANTDLDIALFFALSPNSAGGFLKLNRDDFDPMDARFPRTGRRIIDSQGNMVTLPDPAAFETAMDDYLLTVPKGSFDAGPDGLASPSRIPDSFVFGEGGMGWDGGFNIGPFGGVTAFSSAVHSFELSMMSPVFAGEAPIGMDPEIFLGTILQNAADPNIRLPNDVKPSEWFFSRFPGAERERLLELPSFPDPSLFTLNGLVFNPQGERFLESANALAAFQVSLNVPPNRSPDNLVAHWTGAISRGAGVFLAAGCSDCHTPPYYTNGQIMRADELGVNPGRGMARNLLVGRLVEARIPSFDQPTPLPPNPTMIDLPPAEGTTDNLALPPGLAQLTGGYKVTPLRGVYMNAPYLHDAGVAVHADALSVNADGSYTVRNASLIGVSQTTALARPVSAAHSLRALLDRDLRNILVANNAADAALIRSNIEGAGHDFYVDPAAGFSYAEQSDLIAFLLALDDNPGAY